MPTPVHPKSGQDLRNVLVEEAENVFSGYSIPEELTQAIAVAECYVRDPDKRAEIYNLLIGHVYRMVLSAARLAAAGKTRNEGSAAIETMLRATTAITDSNRVRRIRIRIRNALSALRYEPSNKVRTAMANEKALDNCYLCGTPIGPASGVVLDHQWAQSAGGGYGKENIFRTHEDCEAPKLDMTFPIDAPIGRFAHARPPTGLLSPLPARWPVTLTNQEDFNRFANELAAAQMRISVLAKQAYKCRACEQDFRLAASVVMSRIEESQSYCYVNMQALCKTCHEAGLADTEGSSVV
tara:strand:- start:494 stop:1381 length:888 start_codon:yes stop_codon:yes gene_type:complete